MEPTPTEPQVEPEGLGVGATVLSAAFAVLIGGVVGVISTFTHAQYPPWGLIGGLLVVAALVAGFRIVFESRVVGGAAALGVLVASAVLSLPASGGTVLTLAGPYGWSWAVGPAVLSAVVLLIPRFGRGRGAPSEAAPDAE